MFQSKEFVKAASNKDLEEFLEWFTSTQLFEVFITKKLNPNLKFSIMFDEAIARKNAAATYGRDSSNSREKKLMDDCLH